jgi:hypothetical protein
MDTIGSFISSSLLEDQREEEWNFGSSYVCPKQIMYENHGIKTKISTSFYTRYRRSVSNAIRKVIHQTWARQGLLWGDWRCEDMGCGVTYQNCRLEGGVCIRCGSPTHYREKKLSDGAGFSGRCDAVVFAPSLDGYLIFKLKSRNTNIILKTDKPYPSDIQQVSAMATLLTRQKWLRVVGRVVLWVGTPKPKPFKYWYYPDTGEDIFEEQLKRKQDVDKSIAEGKDVQGICKAAIDAPPSCPFKDRCFEGEKV